MQHYLYHKLGRYRFRFPGSESMACNKSLSINVGYPIFSSIFLKYQPTRVKPKGAERGYRKSDGS